MARFGIKEAKKRTELKLTACTCPNCFEEDTLYAEIFPRYFHVYWVPVFPIGKYALAQCDNCGHVIQQRDFPEELKPQIKESKKSIKLPLKYFTGSILITLFLIYGFIRRSQVNNRDISYIAQPALGDLYGIRIKGGYTLLKVADIKGDSTGFYQTPDKITKYLKLKRLQREAKFGSDTIYYLKSSLFDMLEEGELVGVERTSD